MTLLFVSGTGTGVGKTIATAAIAAVAVADGQQVALVKPAQTGLAPGEPGDVDVAGRLSGVTDLHELVRYPEPLAPATAARRCGLTPVPWVDVLHAVADLAATRDLVVVEGAGGLLVHLDEHKGTVVDVAAALGADVLIVTSPGLGSLNAVALTAEAVQTHEAFCAGVVIGSWPAAPDLPSRCNVDDFEDYAGAPLVGALPERMSELGRADFLRVARESLAPKFGGTWDAEAFRDGARTAVN